VIPRADPASTPRIGSGGEATRARPIYLADSSSPPWKVEVTPLEYVTTQHLIAAGRPRAIFEVRAEFMGEALAEHGGYEGPVHRVETWTTEDHARAKAVAVSATELLRAGREPVLISLAAKFPA
jgi:hypothetical protein